MDLFRPPEYVSRKDELTNVLCICCCSVQGGTETELHTEVFGLAATWARNVCELKLDLYRV